MNYDEEHGVWERGNKLEFSFYSNRFGKDMSDRDELNLCIDKKQAKKLAKAILNYF